MIVLMPWGRCFIQDHGKYRTFDRQGHVGEIPCLAHVDHELPIVPILGSYSSRYICRSVLLPQYALSIVPGQICVFGVFFMVVQKCGYVAGFLEQTEHSPVLAAVSVLSGFAADVFFIRYGYGLSE